MTFRRCIESKVSAGQLSREQGDDVFRLLDEMERHYSARGSQEWARAKAAEATMEQMAEKLARKRRLTQLRILKTDTINKQMREHSKGMAAGAYGVVTRDMHNEAKGPNVEYQQKIIRGQLHAMLDKAIERLRPKTLGLRQEKASLRSFVRAVYGEKVADPDLAAMAKAWGDTAEYAKQRFNAAGGDIGKREDWRLPNPQHNAKLMRQAGFTAWRDAVLPKLDRDRMLDLDSGLPVSDERLELLLQDTFTAITTGGWSRRQPGAIGGRALANRRQESRFLSFKTADDWLAYNDQFGSRDVFETIIGHVDRMAGDIGLLEVMGPSPNAMLRYMQDSIRQDAALKGQTVPKTRINYLGHTYDVVAGRLSGEEMSPIMTLFSDVRSILTSAQLGSAFLAAIPGDMATVRMTAKMSGLPAARVMGRYMKLMTPGNAADRVLATRLALIAENAAGVALAQQRYTGEFMRGGLAQKTADVVLRASLLSPHTQSMKWAFGMELLGFLADQGGKKLDQLPTELAGTLQRYGIGSETWDRIRTAERHPDGFLFPEKMPDQSTYDRLMRMVMEETALAVPEADARVRGITAGGTKADSIDGQIRRSVMMYKAFPVSIITGQIARGLSQRGGFKKGAYLAELMILLTATGALSMQLRSLANGKDPQDPTDPDKAAAFWGAAALKGGGLGIFGDFLFSESGQNRFGGGFAETAAGPMAALAGDIIGVTIGNATDLAQGNVTNASRELLKLAQSNIPGNNLWYARLALQRVVFDQLELMIDPKAPQRMRDLKRRTKKEYDQEFWYPPGSLTPRRAPDLAPAIGQ